MFTKSVQLRKIHILYVAEFTDYSIAKSDQWQEITKYDLYTKYVMKQKQEIGLSFLRESHAVAVTRIFHELNIYIFFFGYTGF